MSPHAVRLARLGVRDDQREVLIGVGGGQTEARCAGRSVGGDGDGVACIGGEGLERRHVVLVLALQLDPKLPRRRPALSALDVALIPCCGFVRHADGVGGEDDPNLGRRDVQLALECGPLDGRDPFDVARPDREQLHHGHARFPVPVGIGPEDVAAGDGVLGVGVGDHHGELRVGVDRSEAEAGDAGGAVVTEGDRLAVLAHGDVGLDVERTVLALEVSHEVVARLRTGAALDVAVEPGGAGVVVAPHQRRDQQRSDDDSGQPPPHRSGSHVHRSNLPSASGRARSALTTCRTPELRPGRRRRSTRATSRTSGARTSARSRTSRSLSFPSRRLRSR